MYFTVLSVLQSATVVKVGQGDKWPQTSDIMMILLIISLGI